VYRAGVTGASAALDGPDALNEAIAQVESKEMMIDDAAAIDSAFMELGGITRSRIVDELGAIAFSDIGDVVDWDNETEHLQPSEPGVGDGHGGKITKVIRARVLVIDKSKIDPRVRRAIAKLVMTDNGGLRVEMHDKLAALDKLARALGMYSETSQVAKDAPPLTAVTIYSGRPDNLAAPGERAAETGDAPGGDGD
jgi:hypothetical protein